MTQRLMLGAGPAAAFRAHVQAGATDGLLTHYAHPHLISAQLTVGAVAFGALRGQAAAMREMAACAQVEILAWLPTNVAHQRLQAMDEWVPNGIAGHRDAAIGNSDGQYDLGLDGKQNVDEIQLDSNLVAGQAVSQLGAAFCGQGFEFGFGVSAPLDLGCLSSRQALL